MMFYKTEPSLKQKIGEVLQLELNMVQKQQSCKEIRFIKTLAVITKEISVRVKQWKFNYLTNLLEFVFCLNK